MVPYPGTYGFVFAYLPSPRLLDGDWYELEKLRQADAKAEGKRFFRCGPGGRRRIIAAAPPLSPRSFRRYRKGKG